MIDIVKIADVGHVRTITLNRPEKKNALSDALAWGVSCCHRGCGADR